MPTGRIFLIGPPGAGKTCCGMELAKLLGCAFFDTDDLIQQEEGMSVSDIFSLLGESYFRDCERRILEKLPGGEKAPEVCVFATGGGLPAFNDNMNRLLQLGAVVWLNATTDALVTRVKGDGKRPLLAKTAPKNANSQSEQTNQEGEHHLQSRISKLIDERREVYALARYKIDTTNLTPVEVAEEIMRLLNKEITR